jgi:hypothetical protein
VAGTLYKCMKKTKYCYVCKRELPTTQFRARLSRPDGLRSECKECDKQRKKQQYQKSKEQIAQYISDIKASGCICCGETTKCCLDFHHLCREDKDAAIAKMATKKLAPRRIIAEIKKCVVVCSNCHRKIHNGLISLPENKNACCR